MAKYVIKSTKQPYALWACGLALLAHILVVNYLATATVGVASTGALITNVVNVSLQQNTPLPHSVALSNSSSVKKANAAIEPDFPFVKSQGSPQVQDLQGPHYFDVRELTQKPLVAIDIPDNFALSVAEKETQIAVLRLLISEYGDVDLALIENSALPDDVKSLLTATFQKMKFHPGERNGKAVKSQLVIAIQLGEEVAPELKEIGFR